MRAQLVYFGACFGQLGSEGGLVAPVQFGFVRSQLGFHCLCTRSESRQPDTCGAVASNRRLAPVIQRLHLVCQRSQRGA